MCRPVHETAYEPTTSSRGGGSTVASQKLWIEHSNGEIRIETHRQPEVSIEASIHVSSSDEEGASKFSSEIEIERIAEA